MHCGSKVDGEETGFKTACDFEAKENDSCGGRIDIVEQSFATDD